MATKLHCPAPARLADHQAGALSDGARAAIQAHLQECAACRTANARVAAARQSLSEIAAVTANVQSTLSQPRIEAALRWSRTQPVYVEPSPFRWGFAFAGLAAAALAGFVGWRAFHRASPTVAPRIEIAHADRIAPAVAPAPKPQMLEALVTLVGGDARLGRAQGGDEKLDAMARLGVGDRLLTAASARVAFQWAEGSGALLGPSSALHLARLDQRAQELALDGGELAVRVGPHQPGEALRVVTPHHAIEVRGTWFVVSVDAHGTTVQVLEGVVEVAALQGDGSSTRIAAPQRAVFPAGRGVGEGARPLSGREASALRQGSEMGLLAWTSLDKELTSTGVFRVGSAPPAELVVDGVSFGPTPVALRRPLGGHLVELTRPGFATIRRWISVGNEPGDLHVAMHTEVEQPKSTPPTPEEVMEVVRNHRRQTTACYEHSLKRDPTLAGTVTLEIHVGPTGQVAGTRIEKDSLRDEEVVECLRREASSLAFAHARNVTVVIPFDFTANRR